MIKNIHEFLEDETHGRRRTSHRTPWWERSPRYWTTSSCSTRSSERYKFQLDYRSIRVTNMMPSFSISLVQKRSSIWPSSPLIKFCRHRQRQHTRSWAYRRPSWSTTSMWRPSASRLTRPSALSPEHSTPCAWRYIRITHAHLHK